MFPLGVGFIVKVGVQVQPEFAGGVASHLVQSLKVPDWNDLPPSNVARQAFPLELQLPAISQSKSLVPALVWQPHWQYILPFASFDGGSAKLDAAVPISATNATTETTPCFINAVIVSSSSSYSLFG